MFYLLQTATDLLKYQEKLVMIITGFGCYNYKENHFDYNPDNCNMEEKVMRSYNAHRFESHFPQGISEAHHDVQPE